jgi:predicted DNA-binding transcriptional regulator YafY
MPDYRATANMLALVRRLEATRHGRLPVNELAAELGVHRRTVLRWLDALAGELVGDDQQPLVRREHRDGVAWAVLGGTRAPLSASVFQYAAVVAATRHLASGSLLAESAEDVVERVEAGLPDAVRALVPRVGRAFHYVPFAPKDHRSSEVVLDAVVQALVRGWPIEVSYTNAAGGAFRGTLHPYTLVMYRDGFYLLAKSPRGRSLRLYALERLTEVVPDRDGKVRIPDDYDPEDELGRHLGLWRTDAPPERVVIAFARGTDGPVRARRWRGFAGFDEGADGRLRLQLDVPITPEITSWILSWGAAAEVLAPESLRVAVAEELDRAWAAYRH